MGAVGGRRVTQSGRGPWVRLAVLALCFLGGLFLGQVFAGRVGDAAAGQLSDYLGGYFALEQKPVMSGKTVLTTLLLYFRYPLAAFLLGFALVGAALLPPLTVAYGFFLSFAVCCFTAAFGQAGVALALAVFGLRCAITLPCYFVVAVPALERSAALAVLALGGRRAAPPSYGRDWWLHCGIAAAVLILGAALELALAPWLLEWILPAVLR